MASLLGPDWCGSSPMGRTWVWGLRNARGARETAGAELRSLCALTSASLFVVCSRGAHGAQRLVSPPQGELCWWADGDAGLSLPFPNSRAPLLAVTRASPQPFSAWAAPVSPGTPSAAAFPAPATGGRVLVPAGPDGCPQRPGGCVEERGQCPVQSQGWQSSAACWVWSGSAGPPPAAPFSSDARGSCI